jgi:hypothetical protein
MRRNWKRALLATVALGIVGGGVSAWLSSASAVAAEAKPDQAAVDRAKEQAKMLDDLYKTAVVGITKTYVNQQGDTPAATVAKQVFAAMNKGGYHNARLVDATGNPKDAENLAKTAFEKKAVEHLNAGKKTVEEVGETDGKPVYRYATPVPALMKQCASCHGVKEGTLLGALVYEVPIK